MTLAATPAQDELQLLDMTMLHGTAQPTVAVLYQDNREARHVRTYKIDIPVRGLPHPGAALDPPPRAEAPSPLAPTCAS